MIHSFPFYIADWQGSEEVAVMTAAERGIYIELLVSYYRQGSLPSCTKRLTKLARVSEREFSSCWPTVSRCFKEDGTRLRNEKADEILAKLAKWQEGRRKGANTLNARRTQPGAKPVAIPNAIATVNQRYSERFSDAIGSGCIVDEDYEVIHKLIEGIFNRHPAAKRGGSLEYIFRIVSDKIFSSVDPLKTARLINSNHKKFWDEVWAGWEPRFVPKLTEWFSTGDCLNDPSAKQVTESEAGKPKFDHDAWLRDHAHDLPPEPPGRLP